MRKDMFKVIVERPRRGGKWGKNGRDANIPYEEMPKTQSMRKKHRDRKELNENLKPLERFFRSRIGKPWDKVYSEVCENLKPDSTVQDHVRTHVKHLVHLHVIRSPDGKILDKRYSWGGEFHEIWHNELYVDPDTGILRRYESKNRRYRWRSPSPEEQINNALKPLDLAIFHGILYKIERSHPRSPKVEPKAYYVIANGTHASHDMVNRQTSLRDFMSKCLTRQMYHDYEYFRVAWEMALKIDALRAQEKAAIERKKKEEAACKSNESV